MIQDHLNSFLLTEKGKIFAFKTFKRISELPQCTNIKYFNFFRSCYVLIEQDGIDCKLSLFSSFGDELDFSSCEFDLSFPKDPVSVDGSRNDEKICVEMIEGPLTDKDVNFLSELLACNLSEESIVDVLLITIDNKLMWIKYKESFQDGVIDGYTMETVTMAKDQILGLKFCDGFLILLDQLSVLTVLYQQAQMLRKNEIVLEGKVKCFRFHHNTFIYSNQEKIIFVDLTKPTEPVKHSVDITGIICFTIVAELNFIIAICRNRLFYYVPLHQPQKQLKKNKNEFEEMSDSDLEMIPCVARYLETEHQNLMEIDKKLIQAQKLKILMHHLLTIKDFIAGDAVIKFHQNLPTTIPDDAVVCKVTDQKFGSAIIEIKIKLSKMFATMTADVVFYRHASSGILTRLIQINCAKEIFHVFMPAESDDDGTNKMSMELNLSYDIKGQTKIISYPIKISQTIPCDRPRIKLRDELDECLKIINEIKM